jgi:hypothetical protein
VLKHHEVPTHLNVEDKVVFGLTVRQFLHLLVGSSGTYIFWEQSAMLGDALRIALAIVSVCTTVILALVRPGGRPLEEWIVAALLFASSPRRLTWRPREPEAVDWRPAGIGWQELAPSLAWAEDDSICA